YNNLARAHLAERNIVQALTALTRALAVREAPATKTLFVDSLKNVLTLPEADRFRPLILRALTEPWGRQGDMAGFAARLLVQSSNIGPAIARARDAWPRRLPLDQLLPFAERKALAADPLLIALVESGHVPDKALERLLTLLRAALLDLAANTTEP